MPYKLTLPQAAAWHSDDADEREAVRAEVRRAARRQLRGSIEVVTILGPDDKVIEVVRSQGERT
ncbi:MAG: hypothetical protein K1X94_11215 [Sandaracinaceae bacterium]|nr:hypothetical protein [Sandaracinaceae bacterium]